MTGAPIIVNSNAPDAANSTGGGVVRAPDFYITGVPGTSGSGQFIGNIHNGEPPTPDPLAYLPEPDLREMSVESNHKLQVSGTQTKTIQPGVYRGGINVTGQGSLTMSAGIYYMDGGGFTFEGQGN